MGDPRPVLPDDPAPPGGQWKDHRATRGGVLHRPRTGCPWRDRPGRSGPRPTAHEGFRTPRRSGLLTTSLSARQLRRNAAGRIDHALSCVDGTNVRASRAAAGAAPPPAG